MLLAGTRLDEVTINTLRGLLGETEGRNLDFKRDQYKAGNAGRKEFAADISSFANTVGGHLILGMAEQDGVASELVGIEFAPNADVELVRLEQVARSGVQPRIPGLRIKRVPLEGTREALVIEIPRSFAKPHRVVVNGSNRFHARGSGGRYQPDVFELRELFEQAPALAEKVRDFRLDRMAQISAGQTPVELTDCRSAYVLHIVPLSSFSGADHLDMDQLRRSVERFGLLLATSRSGPQAAPTMHGLVVHDDAYSNAYTSVWRTGQIEAVIAPVVNPTQDRIPAWVSADMVRNCSVNGLSSYIAGLGALGTRVPMR